MFPILTVTWCVIGKRFSVAFPRYNYGKIMTKNVKEQHCDCLCLQTELESRREIKNILSLVLSRHTRYTNDTKRNFSDVFIICCMFEFSIELKNIKMGTSETLG